MQGTTAAAENVFPDRAVVTIPTDQISLAVVPAAADHDYFRDGVIEDLIYVLSADPSLLVIAGPSSFRFRGRATDCQIAAMLGVSHVLEVGVKLGEHDIALEGRLIDAASGQAALTFVVNGTRAGIQALQAEFAVKVAGYLGLAEPRQPQCIPMVPAQAYDLFLHGSEQSQAGTKEAMRQALSLFSQAARIDEDFALAHAMIAWCHFWRKAHGWMESHGDRQEGIRHAHRALELDADDALVLTRCGHSLVHLAGDFDTGIGLLDKACGRNPNLMPAWFLGGWGRVWHGDPEFAIFRFERAIRLSPTDPEMFRMEAGIALSHLFAGRIDAASSWAERSFSGLPTTETAPGIAIVLTVIAASQALANRRVEAELALAQLRQLMPTLNIAGLREWLPVHREEDLAILAEGVRRAGLRD